MKGPAYSVYIRICAYRRIIFKRNLGILSPRPATGPPSRAGRVIDVAVAGFELAFVCDDFFIVLFCGSPFLDVSICFTLRGHVRHALCSVALRHRSDGHTSCSVYLVRPITWRIVKQVDVSVSIMYFVHYFITWTPIVINNYYSCYC